MTQLKTVPAKARCFAASVEVRTNGDDAKTAPITIMARSGDAVSNWFWGAVVHDMSGMTVPKPRLPLDYCHDDDEVIGYANKFDTSTGELVATGALVPYSPDPDDKASEIIYKSQAGVPYEASIFFDGPLSVEEVAEGATAFANGKQFTGPVTIIRQWTLRGIAVCPYGQDGSTSSELKLSRAGDIQAQVTTKENMKMAAGAEVQETVEAEATQTDNANPSEESGTAAEQEQGTETQAEGVEAEPSPEAAAVEANAMGEGQKFLNCFGDQGGVWFAQGKTFSEAQDLFIKSMLKERDRLSKENGELKTKLSASRGERSPVTFSTDPSEPDPNKPVKQHSNLTPGLSRFAATINIKK